MEYSNEEEKSLVVVLEEGKKMIASTEGGVSEAENEAKSLEGMLSAAEAEDEAAQMALDKEIEAIFEETDAAAVELADYLDQGETI